MVHAQEKNAKACGELPRKAADRIKTGEAMRQGASLLSIEELTAKLGCSQRQVYRMADKGEMPRPIKLGRLNRWVASTIEAWLAEKDARINAKRFDTATKICAN